MAARWWDEHRREKTYLVPQQLADFAGAGVRNGNNLDQLSVLNILVLDLGRRESRIQTDAPVRAQPNKRLEGDDGPAPDKGPFGGANVLFVEIRGQIVPQEDGPKNGKRPNVGVEVEGQRTKQLRMLDLRIVHEGCHDRQII